MSLNLLLNARKNCGFKKEMKLKSNLCKKNSNLNLTWIFKLRKLFKQKKNAIFKYVKYKKQKNKFNLKI